jgi:4-hydroxy-tetrahydrodipicolinate reductase
MNIAVVGDGRTGREVVKLLRQAGPNVKVSAVFNEKNPVNVAALKTTDVAIVFVPPNAMDEVVPVLVEAQVDVVCGTTGYEWPEDLIGDLQQSGARWIMSHNFSLGMNLVRRCLHILGQSTLLYGQPQFEIEEVHHTNKVDAPSGTAISWQNWLQRDCNINSIRQGDVNGIHQLTLHTQFEQIQLRHEAKDRALFAQGAIWATTNLFSQPELPGGIVNFSSLVDTHLANTNLNEQGATSNDAF